MHYLLGLINGNCIFPVKKCNLLYCGSIDGPDVSIDGSVICKAHCVRDSGVLVDPQLKFMAHINSIVSRAHTRSNLILKCFVSRDRTTLVKAFTTYLRPLVEYASPVWSPSRLTPIDKIETVQRRFTKRIPGLQSHSYHIRLTLLGIQSLEAGRLKADLLYRVGQIK